MFCSLAHTLGPSTAPARKQRLDCRTYQALHKHPATSGDVRFLDQCALQGAPTPWIHQRRRSGRHNRRCRPHHRRAAPCPRSGSSSSVAMHSSEHLHLLLCLPLLVIFEHFHKASRQSSARRHDCPHAAA